MEHKKQHFSDETIAALVELGEALRVVHNRLISEGYTLVDGKFVPPEGKAKSPSS